MTNSEFDTKILKSLIKVFVVEFLIISGLILVFYLLLAAYSYFTFNGNCVKLVQGGYMPCSIKHAVFLEPVYAILILVFNFSWILIPLLFITTIVLTLFRIKKLN
jgi:hypothetical protein